jgi:hypothetical protein
VFAVVVAQQIGKLIGRDGFTEIKTLHLIADKIPQKELLLFRGTL